MMGDGMMWGMGLWGFVLVVLVIAALVKYIFFWLNTEVRQAWAYRDLMSIIPIIGAGFGPVLQWIVIPLTGFHLAVDRRQSLLNF